MKTYKNWVMSVNPSGGGVNPNPDIKECALYEKPIIISNEELAEGVYALSGSSADCWTVEAVSVDNYDGANHVFEVRMVHSTAVTHSSAVQTITLSFSNNITAAFGEFPCAFSDNTVTITREVLEDTLYSGVSISFKVYVQAGSQDLTEQLYCVGATIICSPANVQGGYD